MTGALHQENQSESLVCSRILCVSSCSLAEETAWSAASDAELIVAALSEVKTVETVRSFASVEKTSSDTLHAVAL